MNIRKLKNNGFTILEIMISLVIMSILIYTTSSFGSTQFRDYKFKDLATKIEYQAKYGKIRAIQNSAYTGTCVDTTARTITLRQMGAPSNLNPCTTTYPIIKKIDLSTEKYVNIYTISPIGGSSNNSNYVFDGRGLASKTGSICIDNLGKQYIKVFVNLTSVRTEKGDGACS